MKNKFYLIILSLIVNNVLNSQIINFPDQNFKNALLTSSSTLMLANWTYENLGGDTVILDANNDGEVQQSEALAVSYLQIANSSISDLTGIEYFTNLHNLNFGYNPISTVTLSTLMQLEVLSSHNSQLTNLNLAGLTNLKILYCINNQINTLDFTGLTSLKKVYCGYNNLSSLDFSGNPELDDLGCEHNPNLSSIKIKNNKMQLYGNQTLYNESWGGNPNLNYICADSFEIAGLQSFLASCGITQPITIDSACELSNNNFAFNTGVSVYPNPSNGIFTVSFEDLLNEEVTLEVFNPIGQRVFVEKVQNVKEHQLVLDELSSGSYIIKVSYKDRISKKQILKK